MGEYIIKEAVIKELEEEIKAGNVALDEDVWINKGLKIALKDIKNQPAANVQPIKYGKWEISSDEYYYYCSECHYIPNGGLTHFCPDCGSNMRGENDG